MVRLTIAEESIAFLQDSLHYTDERLTLKLYDGLNHALSEMEIEDLGQWIMGVLL